MDSSETFLPSKKLYAVAFPKIVIVIENYFGRNKMSFTYEITLNRQPSYVFTDEVYSSS